MNICFMDSGVGGFATYLAFCDIVVKKNCKLNMNLFYFADFSHSPYGSKSRDEICLLMCRNVEKLLKLNAIDIFVLACNTATACAIKTLRARFPSAKFVGVEPAIKQATAINKNTLVLTTTATYLYSSYVRSYIDNKNNIDKNHNQTIKSKGKALEINDAKENNTRKNNFKDNDAKKNNDKKSDNKENNISQNNIYLSSNKKNDDDKNNGEKIGNSKIFFLPLTSIARNIDAHLDDAKYLSHLTRQLLAPYLCHNITNVVLGCTHYNFLAPHILALLPTARLCEPSRAVARQIFSLIEN